jgi:hypothetical protein
MVTFRYSDPFANMVSTICIWRPLDIWGKNVPSAEKFKKKM